MPNDPDWESAFLEWLLLIVAGVFLVLGVLCIAALWWLKWR